MPVKVLAIDPDVWKASVSDLRCQVVLWDVWENPENQDKYAIAFDNGEIEYEYVELLTSNDIPKDLKKLLQDIFNQRERNNRILTIQSHFSDELRREIARRHCETPVEPALIGMAAGAEPNLSILLVGTNLVRHRGLHEEGIQKNFRRFFRSKLRKGFEVKVASAIGLPGRNESIREYQGREFENQVRLIMMQRVYAKFGVMPCFERKTPGQVFNYRDSDGVRAAEIDSYLFLDRNGIRYVWIVECELKEEGNEGQPTTDTKMKKLASRVDAAGAFEKTRTNNSVETRGYMVTNAEAPHPSAAQIAYERGLQFVSVSMPKDWKTNLKWMLREIDFPTCDI